MTLAQARSHIRKSSLPMNAADTFVFAAEGIASQLEVSDRTRQRFAALTQAVAYEHVRADTERRVVRWRWATWIQFELEIHCSLKYGYPRGRWLNQEPTIRKDKWLHGLDSEDRVLVVRQMTEFANKYSEWFYMYSTDTTEC